MFTILEAATLAQNIIAINQKQQQSGITKYDLTSVLYQAKPVLKEKSPAEFAQLFRDFPIVFCKDQWNMGKCDLVQHRIQNYPNSTPVKLPNHRMLKHFKSDFLKKWTNSLSMKSLSRALALTVLPLS